MSKTFAAPPILGADPLAQNAGLNQTPVIHFNTRPQRLSGTWSPQGGLQNVGGNGYGQTGGGTTEWWEYDVVIPATKTGRGVFLELWFWKANIAGIVAVSVDGSVEATIDTYAAATTTGIAGFYALSFSATHTRPTKHNVRFAVNGKNASSTGYSLVLMSASFYVL